MIRQNSDGPLRVGLFDTKFSDNFGGFRVRVRPLRLRDCAAGGWAQFNDDVASEADCVAVVP